MEVGSFLGGEEKLLTSSGQRPWMIPQCTGQQYVRNAEVEKNPTLRNWAVPKTGPVYQVWLKTEMSPLSMADETYTCLITVAIKFQDTKSQTPDKTFHMSFIPS